MLDSSHPIYTMSKEEIFYNLLQKEQGYYQAIADLSRRQYECLAAQASIDVIKPFMRQKRVLFSYIQEIEKTLLPLKSYWQEKKDHSDEVSLKILQLISALDALVKDIIKLDDTTQKKLEHYMFVYSSKNKPN